MLQFRGLTKHFGSVTAVTPTDLDIDEGTLVTLLGPSGCGKTTMLRMVAGLETPTAGDILIRGRRINDTPIHRRNLGMIFQNYALFPHKTIFDNVAFGLKYRQVPRAEIEGKVRRALEMVRLPGVERRRPAQLSGGQQQRIALARAIVIEPDVLLMDEPLSALDENLRQDMRREIDSLQQLIGVTTIFVTHDQREALSMSDKIVVIKDGRIQQSGTPQDVYNRPANHFVADFLGHSNFMAGTIEGTQGDDRVAVRLDNGTVLRVRSDASWPNGARVEAVVRAQRFEVFHQEECRARDKANRFQGVIKDRSYMGGEVNYYIEIADGSELHVISMMRMRLLRIGDPVFLQVAAKHCHLLPLEA